MKDTIIRRSSIRRFFRIILLILIFSGFASDSWSQYNFYYGTVLDAMTKAGIPDVNLSVPVSRIGTVTDKKGAFSFFIDSIPATLIVSCVGFETKHILLDRTSFSLTLYLNREVKELAEVEIRARGHEPFFKDDLYAVLDYEIDSGLIYLLVFRQGLSGVDLLCKNHDGDTLATSKTLYFNPFRLFKDCLGTLHVLGRDSGFQVYRQDNRLHLIHPVRLKKFDDVLKNCVAATTEFLYFKKSMNRGLGVEYYGVNRKTFVKQDITEVKDEKKLKMMRRNADDAALLMRTKHPDSRDDFVTWNYIHKILYRPIKTALYKIGDFICIFNTPEQQMEFYDLEGNFSYKLALQIGQVTSGKWTGDILIDEQLGKIYTHFVSNGQYTLYRIDLNTGLLRKRLGLFHYYPEKIRVNNDFVYYLYDVAADPDNKMLFRQEL